MRTWFVIICILAVTAVYATAVMLHMALFREQNVFFWYARNWSAILLKLAGVKVELRGREKIKPATRYVYAANHSSLFDIPVILASVPDNIRIMYKKELERIPIFGWCLKMSPFISVNRSRSREAADALEDVIVNMSSGQSVLVFPEGTRSPDGRVGVFRRGAVNMAVRSKTPLIPLSVLGTANILPARTKRIQGGHVTVIVGDVVETENVVSSVEEKRLTEALRTIIADNVNL